MKRIILYVLILCSLPFLPLESMEIANLEPVQAVWMYEADGMVVLETDTEDKGTGGSVEEALADMKQKSPGIIYLDTAQYLLVSEKVQQQIAALQAYVKGSVRLCQWDGQGDMVDAVKYADAHKVGEKLKDWNLNVKLPKLPLINQSKKGEIPD